MNADVEIVARDGEVGMAVVLPAQLITYIASGGSLDGKRAVFAMDREQALVVADELRQAALSL